VVGWIAGAALIFVLLDVFGVDIGGWIGGLWDTLGSVSPPYLIGAITVQTVQIVSTAIAWLFILRAGYPRAKIAFAPILAAYAVGGALNSIVPAKLGSLVMLFMFIAIIPGATFAGVFAAFLVEKIFFTVMGGLVYVYLFGTVPGSFSVELGGLRDHPWLTGFIVIGGSALIVFVGRFFWEKLRKLWLEAKQGGAILSTPRKYFVQVVLPCFVSYVARLGVIAIMLAAFAIPVTFNSVMHVVAGNSIAGNTAATPGGAGVIPQLAHGPLDGGDRLFRQLHRLEEARRGGGGLLPGDLVPLPFAAVERREVILPVLAEIVEVRRDDERARLLLGQVDSLGQAPHQAREAGRMPA